MASKSQYDLSSFPYFQYKGRKSNEMGMRILKSLELIVPEAQFSVEDVDGLNRDVIISRNKYSDIDKVFPVRLFKNSENHIAQSMREVAAWLYNSTEYVPVTFSEYDEYFYKGFAYGGAQAIDENVNGLWVDFQIKFKMQPFIFRVNGTEERSISSGQVLTNPEEFSSLPLIQFDIPEGLTKESHFFINGRQFTFDSKELGKGTFIIDNESGIAYNKDTLKNVSSDILITNDKYEPISLEPKRNVINYDGITNVKITPNWRTLAV